MKTVTRTVFAVVFATTLSGSGIAAAASASDDDKIDLQTLRSAKISVTQAIRAAEQADKGRVWSASLIVHKGHPAYEVHLLTADGQASNVIVDGQTGQVAPDPGDAAENETGNEPEDAE